MGRKAGSTNKDSGGFKWSRKLNPDALFPELEPVAREAAQKTLRELAPRVAEELVRRLRAGQLARNGEPVAMPQYSNYYAKLLKRAGESTSPDLTLGSGGLLDHLSARVKQLPDGSIQLQIVPYGATAGTEYQRLLDKINERNRQRTRADGAVWKDPYTYTRNGKLVTVQGHWVQSKRKLKDAKAKEGQAPRRVTYQSIANQLSYRLGYGAWAKGGKAPSSFLTITKTELATLQAAIQANDQKAVAALIAKSITTE